MRMSSTGSASFRTARRLAIRLRPLAVGLLLAAMAWPAAAQETPPPATAPETSPAAAAPQTPPPAAAPETPPPAAAPATPPAAAAPQTPPPAAPPATPTPAAAPPATPATPAEEKAAKEQLPAVNEEITVTARKREETLQDVPFSVAAPTEEVLRSRGVDSIEGVAANVAGFTVQNLGPGQSQVALRGVSSGQIVRDQPGVKEQVGIYLDETPISLTLL